MRAGGKHAPAAVPWRSAILGDERVEYVRGPDLATVLAKEGVPEIEAVGATISEFGWSGGCLERNAGVVARACEGLSRRPLSRQEYPRGTLPCRRGKERCWHRGAALRGFALRDGGRARPRGGGVVVCGRGARREREQLCRRPLSRPLHTSRAHCQEAKERRTRPRTAHPPKHSLITPSTSSFPFLSDNFDSLPPPARAAALANALLARRFLIRSSRVYWKPRPGMERLAKWPKKLAMAPPADRAAFSPARHTFYAWTFDRPSSPYAWVYSALVVTAVLAACLFPLAPHWVKLGAFYASSGLLAALTALLTVRGLLALGTWLTVGRAVWLFPLLLDENTGLDKAFKPMIEVAPAPTGSRKVHLIARGVTAAALAASLVAVAFYAPIDRKAAGTGLRGAHDALLEALNLHHRGMDKLGNGNKADEKGATAPPPPTATPETAEDVFEDASEGVHTEL